MVQQDWGKAEANSATDGEGAEYKKIVLLAHSQLKGMCIMECVGCGVHRRVVRTRRGCW